MHDLRALVALPVAIGAGFIGWAVAQTWNATLTAFALCGLVLVLGIAAHGLSSAAGVAYHDRRAAAGHGPQQAIVYPPGMADPLAMYKARELASRADARDRTAALDGWTPAQYSVTSWDDQQGEGWE